jgi:prephenate dehydrogenase
VLDPTREAAVFAARRAWGTERGLDAEGVEEIFRAIVRASRRVQRT